jgi:hypothetical protein
MDTYQTGLPGPQAYEDGEVFVIPESTRVKGFGQGVTELFHPSLLGLFVQALRSIYFNVALGLVKPRKAGDAKSWSRKNQRLSSKFPEQSAPPGLSLTRQWQIRQRETRETEFAIVVDTTLLFSTDTHYIDIAHPLHSHHVTQEVTPNLAVAIRTFGESGTGRARPTSRVGS